jgi:Fe-S-cluster-containing dehydrogenase component
MKLEVHADRCTGCESCVLTCSFEHESIFQLQLARVQVKRDENLAVFQPRVCVQCPDRFCVASCSVGALSIAELGNIVVDIDACVGCRKCEAACPFGGIHFAAERRAPIVCDLCGGSPSCVSTCQKPQAIRIAQEGE